MREIKFRGKALDNGRWVYGSLIISKPFADEVREAWIREETILPLGAISTPTANFVRVDPKTVGQYTGLKDKNGREIYEGALLEEGAGYLFEVIYDPKWARYKLQWRTKAIQFPEWNRGKQMAVIGNIHENPELLK
jgi:hypothetical protein